MGTGLIVGLGPVPRNPSDSHYVAVPHALVRKLLGPGALPEAEAAGVEVSV